MVDFVKTAFGVSIRRACRAVPAPRSTYHYVSRRPPQEPLRKRIRELAETHVRYGYRRIHVLLRREGWAVNVKRVRRLYNLEGLQMRLKPPRRRVMAKLRSDRSDATGPNQVWAMDWMFDETFAGRRLWVLTIVDTWSRVCPAMRVCRSATAMEVIEALEEAGARFGLPQAIRVDQGAQFTSREMDLWAYANGVTLDFSRPPLGECLHSPTGQRASPRTTPTRRASMPSFGWSAWASTGSWTSTTPAGRWKTGVPSITT